VKTILRLAGERSLLRVVDDQRGNPTSAFDLAGVVIGIGQRLTTVSGAAPAGTYHFVNAGEATWFELAQTVLARAATRGRKVPPIEAIPSRDYPTPAKRPANSRLATTKLQQDFDIVPRQWRQAIATIVDELMQS
jgi:dTDP-4-dehydrorhamnose reductase